MTARYGASAEPTDSIDTAVMRLLPRPKSGAVDEDDGIPFELDDELDSDDADVRVARALRTDEFTCRSCHLVVHVTRSAGGGYCHDCA